MKKFVAILILGVLFYSGTTYGFRTEKPNRLTEFDQNNLVILNRVLESLWDISNGRFNLDIVTTNPDGNTKGDVGDMLLFNDSGTYYLEINTTGAKVWRGILLSDTP